ncbi:MAG: hypothetical protein HN411_04445 [Waddliaceae bacterium]|jgi:hypothetical protein|nr:hypothetical protein [Waddliaceae bacterium]MBT3579329.1 hypothetical protein [Waddliaceae bacterium]MBT4445460.1 hypothetical protein [Waddliaceae bacterium]MBT6928726.1 hypothetical protein [Waddliaceae bacterium]MBT7265201.1 hypothetical protein [Waddliaceae bacterium]
MTVGGLPDNVFGPQMSGNTDAEQNPISNENVNAIASQVRSSINNAVDRFFINNLSPPVVELHPHAWNAYVNDVTARNMSGILSDANELIQQVIQDSGVSKRSSVHDKENSELTSLCLEYPIELIAKIGNPNLLHECEKIRLGDALTGVHASIFARWKSHLSAGVAKKALKKVFATFEELEEYWEGVLSNIGESFSEVFSKQQEYFRGLSKDIDAAWSDICHQHSIDLSDEGVFSSNKERFLTNLLETWWVKSGGDLTKIPPADLVLLLENRGLIKKASLGQINSLTDDQLEGLVSTFVNLEDISFDGSEEKEYAHLSSRGLESFTKLQRLTTLKLNRLGISAQKQLIDTLPKFPKLTSLRLEHFTMTSKATKIIGDLALTSLALIGGVIDRAAFKKNFIDNDEITTLTSLELRENIGKDVEMISPEDALALIKKNPEITTLRLSSSELSDKYLRHLASFSKKLRFLDLGSCGAIGSGAVTLLQENPQLEVLVLHHDASMLDHIDAMAAATSNLVAFEIRHLGEAPIAFAKNNSRLKAATCYDYKLNDAALIRFAHNATGLTSVTISITNDITSRGLETLGKLCPHLRIAGFFALRYFDWKNLLSFTKKASHLEGLCLGTFRDHVDTAILGKIIDTTPSLRWINICPHDASAEKFIAEKNASRTTPITITDHPQKWWIQHTILH